MCFPSHVHAYSDAICHLCDKAKQVEPLKFWLSAFKTGWQINFLIKYMVIGILCSHRTEAVTHVGTPSHLLGEGNDMILYSVTNRVRDEQSQLESSKRSGSEPLESCSRHIDLKGHACRTPSLDSNQQGNSKPQMLASS